MQRRVLLKNMMFVAGGIIAIPSWAANWNKTSLGTHASYLSANAEAILAEIVETIIPATDTPGAKELGVDVLVKKIVADCYEKEVQEIFAKGLNEADVLSLRNFGKSFTEITPIQRLDILKEMEKREQSAENQEARNIRSTDPQAVRPAPGFFRLVKELTILGYTNSEYVMMNLTGYVAVPGHYHGCVPYSPKKSA